MITNLLAAIGTLAVLAFLVLIGMAILMPKLTQASERARLEREAQAAAWRIHQQATAAFAQMLEAARSQPGSKRRGGRA